MALNLGLFRWGGYDAFLLNLYYMKKMYFFLLCFFSFFACVLIIYKLLFFFFFFWALVRWFVWQAFKQAVRTVHWGLSRKPLSTGHFASMWSCFQQCWVAVQPQVDEVLIFLCCSLFLNLWWFTLFRNNSICLHLEQCISVLSFIG